MLIWSIIVLSHSKSTPVAGMEKLRASVRAPEHLEFQFSNSWRTSQMWPNVNQKISPQNVMAGVSADSRRTILVVGATILTYHALRELIIEIPADGVLAGLKRAFYKILRALPSIRREIDEQMALTTRALESHIGKLYIGADGDDKESDGSSILELPPTGAHAQDILTKLEQYMKLGRPPAPEQRLSGASYFTHPSVEKLYSAVYEKTLWTNPLHFEVFPGICKMEAELVRMACRLFGDQNDECCGTLTSGGTESIVLAVKAYRDFAMQARGIRKPEILVPVTAHAAFNKAAQLLRIGIKRAPMNLETCAVDIRRMESMITRNTCMLVASAPAYPHGCMDDVVAVAQLGLKYRVPLHVDACLGGMLLAFKARAEPFDFRVDGVSSISVDTHKYGFTPKGSSILLFRDARHRRHQYFTDADWPGGLYASSTLAGSKCGASIAACWASFLHFGAEGYVKATKQILEASAYIKRETAAIEGLNILGNPTLSIIAWSSDEFDIYSLLDAMNKKGWTMNALQFPPAIHICISYPQAKPEVAAKFVQDMKACVHELRNPAGSATVAPSDGVASIYGSSQKVPFRELVHETACVFLDTLNKIQLKDGVRQRQTRSSAS